MRKLATRKGRSIILNNNIRITVEEIKGNQAYLVVKAPDDVSVVREDDYFAEIKARVDKEVAEQEQLAANDAKNFSKKNTSRKISSKLITLVEAIRGPITRVFDAPQ